MKLISIKIVGYKSINEIEFPIRKYGTIDSYTTILLGKNETGKSNILDAMATPALVENKTEVDFLKIRNQQEEPDLVSIFFAFSLDNDTSYRSAIKKTIDIPEELLNDIILKQFIKKIYLKKDITTFSIDYDFIIDRLPLENYYLAKEKTEEPAQKGPSIQSQNAVEKTVIKKFETWQEDKDAYSQLGDDEFRNIIKEALLDFSDQITIPVDVWRASEEYLIQDKIQLKDFAKNQTNLPLKNMFYLVGQKTKDEIIQKINEIETDNKQRRKLAGTLSKNTTEYLNKKWKEHEIDVEVEISDNLVASVFIKDKCDKENYFEMSDRSQGFKQFISLLLSLSINNDSGDIENHLILIDEPEIHLHPSGIRSMLKELLEIGKNNFLFISTHSNFMLDKDTKERHFLITKGKDNLTKFRQIKTEEDIIDDEILKSAFGINVIADFLSTYKILVEGPTDKKLLLKALNQINKNHGILITNGAGNNVPATASLMDYHNINPITITDDDETGRKIKENVMKISDNYKQNAFTIRDLNSNIVDYGTIEDTLPKDFVESTINGILKSDKIEEIKLNEDSPFCKQLELHLNQKISEETNTKKNKKQKIDNLIQEVKKKIAEYDEKSITETDSPKLYQLASAILEKMGIKK